MNARTLKNIDNQGIESQNTQENMVQFYVFEAYNIIHKSAREIILSISDGKEQEQLLKILNEKYGIMFGKNLGDMLKIIEKEWVNNNFQLSQSQIDKIINR